MIQSFVEKLSTKGIYTKLMKQRTKDIYSALISRFGEAGCELKFKNHYELIVAVILSARCTDKRVNEITKDLFVKYPTPLALSNASQEELEKDIYSCGFYHNKSKNLISMAKDLVSRFDSIVPNTYEDLLSLAGVGRKTANVVMSVGFSIPAIAVDTHVFRVSNRLAMVKAQTPLQCELSLQKEVDKDKWGRFHHLLVLFGRYVCSSQHPHCKDCELKQYCCFYKSNHKPCKK